MSDMVIHPAYVPAGQTPAAPKPLNKVAVRTFAAGAGVFTAGSSAFVDVTARTVNSGDGDSWSASVLYESGVHLNMAGLSDWYIPAHENEDGSWSLAQFGPRPTASISAYRSVLASARHSGGQTELSLSETAVSRSVFISPGQERPAGAVDYRNERLDQLITQEMLARVGENIKPLPLRRFDLQV